MALTKLHGWTLTVGTIGTDLDIDKTLSLSGGGSLQMQSTAVGTYVVGDPIPIDNNRAHLLEAAIQQSALGGGANTVTLVGSSIGISKALAPPHPTIWATAALPGANTWYRMAVVWEPTANARFIQLQAYKAAIAFTVNLDHLRSMPLPYAFTAFETGATTLPAGAAWHQIDLDGEVYDWGGHFDEAAGFDFVAPRDGPYHFDGAVEFDAAATNIEYGSALYVNGALARPGAFHRPHAAHDAIYPVSADLYLTRGQSVELWGYNGHAVNPIDTVPGVTHTFLNGHEIAGPRA